MQRAAVCSLNHFGIYARLVVTRLRTTANMGPGAILFAQRANNAGTRRMHDSSNGPSLRIKRMCLHTVCPCLPQEVGCSTMRMCPPQSMSLNRDSAGRCAWALLTMLILMQSCHASLNDL